MTTRPTTPSPDDILSLKALLLEKDKRISLLEEQVRLLKHKRFAASSEKSDGQAELFNEAEAAEPVPEEDLNENTDDAETDTIQYERRKSRGRKALPADLPRVRIEHDLSDADKVCECGCALTHIGEDTSEQLDIIPAKIQVLQHARLKYACKACESTVRTAVLPAQPIPKSNASAGLLAYVATAKYQDALPLHRQESIFKRMEVDIPRNTLANWMMRSGELMTPLITQLDSEIRRGKIIQCDETPLQVLNEPDRPASSQSYMWVRRSGAPDHPIVLYDYAPSRAGSVAERLLKDFSGYLQTDDYAGYHAVGRKDDISHVGCWAHARRKFIDAQKAATSKDKKTARIGKADVAINYIAKLYAIEKQAKDTSSEARRQLRQDKSVPILKALREWLDKTLHSTLPKGLLGTALGYLNKNWEKLIRYTEDGDVNIDNNLAENAIRPFVIGRKNWLFSATPRGAHASAAIYSLIETAKANGLEPYAYLREVFAKLPRISSDAELQALLPWNVSCV
jgi:transposase